MSVLSRSRLAVLSAMAAVPAVLLVSACDNSTSPKAQSTADTVGVNPNSFIVEQYDSNEYYTEATVYDGDYTEVYDGDDYREVMQYALPALHGQRVVDSASVFEYVCDNYTPEGRVTPGPHATAAAQRLAARRAGHPIGARDLQPAVLLDHVYYTGAYTDSTVWGADLMGASAQLIGSNDVSLGWKEASVTSAVKADYAAGHANSQFRVRYASNPGSGEYYVEFGSTFCENTGDAGASRLVIWSH